MTLAIILAAVLALCIGVAIGAQAERWSRREVQPRGIADRLAEVNNVVPLRPGPNRKRVS